jgi:tRNA-modifying protein YgfZ
MASPFPTTTELPAGGAQAGPVAAQLASARRSVLAVADVGVATLVVTGADRVTWLNGLVTCDLAGAARASRDDDASYGLVVGRTGRVIVDAVIVMDGPSVYLTLPATALETLRAHFEHYLVMEDAEVTPAEGAESWLVHGPRSAEVLRAARAAGAAGGVLDRTGLGGAALLAPRGQVGQVRDAIERAVAAAGGGVVGDAAAWEALRLERAVPRFGVDFDDKTYPQEASLEKVAVSFNKGCYLGQEVVCMLELRGHVKRKLAALVFDSPVAPARKAGVVDDAGTSIGEITSAVASPTLGVAVGLAMLKQPYSGPGAVVHVDGVRAKVVDRPA